MLWNLCLPSPVTLMFNRPSRGILPRFTRPPIGCDNDQNNNSALRNRQPQTSIDVSTCKNIPFSTYRINQSSTVRRWRMMEPWYGMEQMITRAEATKYEWWRPDEEQNEEACGGHPNISGRLPEEEDIQSQQTTNRQQAQSTHGLVCFTEPTWTQAV